LQRLSVTTLAADALTIAADRGLSAYDACYVAASQRLGVPLITVDSKLVTKVAGSVYTVLDLRDLVIPPP
jgi:predicted nucleic acid-binding protein